MASEKRIRSWNDEDVYVVFGEVCYLRKDVRRGPTNKIIMGAVNTFEVLTNPPIPDFQLVLHSMSSPTSQRRYEDRLPA